MSRAAETERFRLAVEAGADITQALAGADAPTVIVRRVAEALDAWECDLYEYDPQSRTLTAAALWARELTDADLAWVGTTIALDDRSELPAHHRGRGLHARRAWTTPTSHPADRAAMLEWGEVATLAVPLRFRDKGVVGCLTLIEKRAGRRFTEEDCELVTLLAGPAAVAVRNARLFRLQQEQNRYLASLLDSARAITSTVTLEDSLAQHLPHGGGGARDGRVRGVRVRRRPRRHRVPRLPRRGRAAGLARGRQGLPAGRLSLGPRDPARRARSSRRRSPIRRCPTTCARPWSEWGEKACLNVPLIVEGEPLGILVLIETTRERVFGPAEVELARALGEQAAIAIRHARLYRRGELQNRRLVALLETSRVLVSSLDVGAVLGQVRREVAGLFAVAGVAVTLLLRRGEAFVPFEAGPAAGGLRRGGGGGAGRAAPPRRRRAGSGAGRGFRRPAPGRPVRLGRRRGGPARRSAAPRDSSSATTSSSSCRSWPARPPPRWPTPPCTARSSGRPSPTASPASTTTATSTSGSTRRSPAPSATACRCRCS